MSDKQEYQVLARKYRPSNFSELIGQEPLVRTLTNAIETGRIAHAFMLTGIRGVGKTTTARIVAKALNYAGPDGKSDPSTGDTSDCEICQAISEGRHPDVIEMDAASHTGVDDIRDLIDGVRYAPASARYKIYIIDEVHMLSKNAFNALLKTLEEPPSHVKFIFATTEIRKVPVTILSRCQRFDLRRIELNDLTQHFTTIAGKEGVETDETAIQMIARAADGSVRDGLSLMDRAIALGDGKIDTDTVKNMLGLTDGTRLLDLFETLMKGNTEGSLNIFGDLYKEGADPAQVIEDVLSLTHTMTKIKVLKDKADLSGLPHGDQDRGKELAQSIPMSGLNKAWQILMKGLTEVKLSPNPFKAAEMLLIRLIYAAELPDPLDLMKKISSGENTAVTQTSAQQASVEQGAPEGAPLMKQAGGGSIAIAQPQEDITAFKDMEALYTYLKPKEVLLANELYEFAHPVKFTKGHIDIRLKDGARQDICSRLSKTLRDYTGHPFMVSPSREDGLPTLSDIAKKETADKIKAAEQQKDVKKVLEAFPGATVTAIMPKDDN